MRASTCRRVLALIGGLPADSALGRDEEPWTFLEQLGVAQVQLVDLWGRLQVSTLLNLHAQHPQGPIRKLPPPPDIRHPRERARLERVNDLDAVTRFFSPN